MRYGNGTQIFMITKINADKVNMLNPPNPKNLRLLQLPLIEENANFNGYQDKYI